MKWWHVGAGVAVIGGLIGGIVAFRSVGACRDFGEATLRLNSAIIYNVSIADEQAEQIRGLIGCNELPEHAGMYFTYTKPTTPSFWMRGMKVPLDIVWIRGTEVIGVEAHVPPAGVTDVEPPRYTPKQPITAVLEIAAGGALANNITIGSTVDFLR